LKSHAICGACLYTDGAPRVGDRGCPEGGARRGRRRGNGLWPGHPIRDGLAMPIGRVTRHDVATHTLRQTAPARNAVRDTMGERMRCVEIYTALLRLSRQSSTETRYRSGGIGTRCRFSGTPDQSRSRRHRSTPPPSPLRAHSHRAPGRLPGYGPGDPAIGPRHEEERRPGGAAGDVAIARLTAPVKKIFK